MFFSQKTYFVGSYSVVIFNTFKTFCRHLWGPSFPKPVPSYRSCWIPPHKTFPSILELESFHLKRNCHICQSRAKAHIFSPNPRESKMIVQGTTCKVCSCFICALSDRLKISASESMKELLILEASFQTLCLQSDKLQLPKIH